MERNTAADDFVNCVVRRSDKDMFLKPSLMIASLIVPLLMGVAISACILIMNSESGYVHFQQEDMEECALAMIISALILESAVMSFMVFCVTRRNNNHLKRDITWMSALSDFVDYHGGDSSELRSITQGSKHRSEKTVTVLSMLIWLIIVAILIAFGVFAHGVTSEEETRGITAMFLVAMAPILLLLVLQFLITVGAVYRFPAKHDSIQTKFSEEFKKQCGRFGLQVNVMEHQVKRRMAWVHITLTILTLGLYSMIYLIIACRQMNRHMSVQWRYEEELMSRIIEFEGGNGIESTCEGQPNALVRAIGRLM